MILVLKQKYCVGNITCDCTPPHVPRFFKRVVVFWMSCAKRDPPVKLILIAKRDPPFQLILIFVFQAAEAHERLFVSAGGKDIVGFSKTFLYFIHILYLLKYFHCCCEVGIFSLF